MTTKLAAVGASAMLMTASGMGVGADSVTPVVRIAELEVDSARLTEYKALLAEEIETSVRVEPGVLSLNAVSLKDAPTHIRLLEVYADSAAYESHLKSAHFLKYKSATSSMVKSLTLLETAPIMLCAKSGGGCLGNSPS